MPHFLRCSISLNFVEAKENKVKFKCVCKGEPGVKSCTAVAVNYALTGYSRELDMSDNTIDEINFEIKFYSTNEITVTSEYKDKDDSSTDCAEYRYQDQVCHQLLQDHRIRQGRLVGYRRSL